MIIVQDIKFSVKKLPIFSEQLCLSIEILMQILKEHKVKILEENTFLGKTKKFENWKLLKWKIM